MNQQPDIDESDFKDWLENPITKEIFLVFTENKGLLEENILTLDPISDNNIDRKNAYIRGSLEICNHFLNLTFDQLFKKEEVKSEDEETPYSW